MIRLLYLLQFQIHLVTLSYHFAASCIICRLALGQFAHVVENIPFLPVHLIIYGKKL